MTKQPHTLTGEQIDDMVTAAQAERRGKRVDVWVEFADGHYRLALPYKRTIELEEAFTASDRDGVRRPLGVFAIYGQVARGRYELDGRQAGFAVEGAASLAQCREVVRLALIGGGTGVVRGSLIKVDATTARRLVENYVDDAPIELAWNLAYAVLAARIEGREPTEAELASADPIADIVPPVPVEQP